MSAHLRQRLRDADPAARIAGYGEVRCRAVVSRIVEAERGDAGRGDAVAAATAGRSRRPRVTWVMAGVPTVVALAVTLLVAVIVGSILDRPSGGTASAPARSSGGDTALTTAEAVLLRAASSSPSDSMPRPSQYWRVESRRVGVRVGGSGPGPASAVYRVWSTRTTYYSVDGGHPTWVVEDEATKVEQLSGPTGVGAPTHSYTVQTNDIPANRVPAGWQVPSTAFLAELPRDTTALRQRLYHDAAGHGRSDDSEVWVLVCDVLRSGLVPADLTAALLRVLATVPGISLVESSAPLDGRATTALTMDERPVDQDNVVVARRELVVDRATDRLLGERTVFTKPRLGLPAGATVGLVRTTRTVVDDVPESVRAAATHQHCEVQGDAGVVCQMPR